MQTKNSSGFIILGSLPFPIISKATPVLVVQLQDPFWPHVVFGQVQAPPVEQVILVPLGQVVLQAYENDGTITARVKAENIRERIGKSLSAE